MTSDLQRRETQHRRAVDSLERAPGPVQALAQLLDELTIEPVVPSERHLAGQPALARPACHGVGRYAQQPGHFGTGQELGLGALAAMRATYVLHERKATLPFSLPE